MTSTPHRNRGEILRSAIAVADVRRDGLLPLDLEGVTDVFEDELALLGAMSLRWHTRLAGRIEREIMQTPMDLERAVLAAWVATADELPGVRAVLDHHREHPLDDTMATAMAKATAKEHAMLAVMAGQASARDHSASIVGARLERAARERWVPSPTVVEASRPSLLSRLRSVLAA